MRITDYEQGRSLQDVAITLTREEAEELAAYLNRMLLNQTRVSRATLSEVVEARLERELTIDIRSPR